MAIQVVGSVTVRVQIIPSIFSTNQEIVNSSKSFCDQLVEDPIAEAHPEQRAVADLRDVNLIETEVTNFNSAGQQSPHCHQFAGNPATVTKNLDV